MIRIASLVCVVCVGGVWACGPISQSPPAAGATPIAQPDPQFRASAETASAPAASSTAQRFVAAHNADRAKHCAPPLTWSSKLEAAAQKWADSLKAQGCKFGHSPNNSYGENLAAGSSGLLDPEATVKMWYGEISKYRFPDGGFSMETGHFTQVVWKGTAQVGCGMSSCNGMDIWVCEYDPPGNVEGEYRTNVLPLGCK